MSAMEPLCRLIGINPYNLLKEENILLEAELFRRICEELKEIFRLQNGDFFRFMKFTLEMENEMIDRNFLSIVIKDILSSGEYTSEGFAQYADTHEDVVLEVLSGRNTNPSAILLRRAIDLHRSVRGELYNAIIKKITAEYLESATKSKEK